MTENGYNEEEMKMVKETRKIWGVEDVNITATCIRVPVMRAHAESINLEFARPITEEAALAALEAAPGVSIINDRASNRFPTPLDASNQDDVFVGRVRTDISRGGDGKGLDLFVCGDQIKKGQELVRWDGTKSPILAEKGGTIRFEDVIEGETVRVEKRGGTV